MNECCMIFYASKYVNVNFPGVIHHQGEFFGHLRHANEIVFLSSVQAEIGEGCLRDLENLKNFENLEKA